MTYKNKAIFNQKGGTIEIDNSTGREKIQISQYSGSNISIDNVVTSELATNNKQTKVVYDEFRTVGNTLSEYTGKDRVNRISENSYSLKGFSTQNQLDAFTEWREAYREIANRNGKFSINRGGFGLPFDGEDKIQTQLEGTFSVNPDLSLAYNTNQFSVNNTFPDYNEVREYNFEFASNTGLWYQRLPVPNNPGEPATQTPPTVVELEQAFGSETGTEAPGIVGLGPNNSSSTEDGEWAANEDKQKLSEDLVKLQDKLFSIEEKMGNGGDDIESVKRHKFENIGAVVNNYPSVRVDNLGKSTLTDIGVAGKGVYAHKGGVPMVEEVDNATNFPCGNYTLNVGNKFNVFVGSGGVQIKTLGCINVNGTLVNVSGTKVNVSATAGVSLQSETHIDIMSTSITLRSPSQIVLGSSLGVNNNLTVRGGVMVGGELYVNHITAPAEIQETYMSRVLGQPVEGAVIGKVNIGGQEYEVLGVANKNSLEIYPHSHHFPNIPITLTRTNEDMRTRAMANNINKPNIQAVASPQSHNFKA
jgi:hypothetical protein